MKIKNTQQKIVKITFKSKVHYASWSETCSLAHASEQVSDRFVGVYDKLTTFSGRKTCLGQDSTITTCRDSASRFATGSLCFCCDSQMDFRKRPDVRTCSTLLWCSIYLFFVRTLLVMLRFSFIDFDRFQFDFSINNSISIRFGFDFFTICTFSWPNSIRVWPCGNGSAAVLATHEAIPPPLLSSSAWTEKMLSGQIQIKQCGVVTRSWSCQVGQCDGTH